MRRTTELERPTVLASEGNRAVLGVLTTLMLVFSLVALAMPAGATTEECPEHNGHPGKVESGDLNDIILESGTSFCVKGSTDASGTLTADGETTLLEYLSNDHDVSYYVVYSVELDEPIEPPTDDDGTTSNDEPNTQVLAEEIENEDPCFDGTAENEGDVCVAANEPDVEVEVLGIQIESTTTTTVSPVTAETLPFTGDDTGIQLMWALWALAAGIAALALGAQRSPASSKVGRSEE